MNIFDLRNNSPVIIKTKNMKPIPLAMLTCSTKSSTTFSKAITADTTRQIPSPNNQGSKYNELRKIVPVINIDDEIRVIKFTIR